MDLRNVPLILTSALAGAVLMAVFNPAQSAEPAELATAVERDGSIAADEPVERLNAGLITNASVLRREADGHYWALATIGRSHAKFMIDTGASTVALTYEDARRLGLDPDNLDFRWSIATAGGQTKGASVLLPSIRIGNVEVENVEAMVLGPELEQSLLGMTFLSELYSYEFRQNSLIIRQ